VLYLRKQVEVASQASEEATRSARLQQAQAEGLERTRFEDSLVLAYRAILSELPPEALMDDPLGEQIPKTVLNPFYRYVDLCNWQVFLRAGKRISDDTWTDWNPRQLSAPVVSGRVERDRFRDPRRRRRTSILRWPPPFSHRPNRPTYMGWMISEGSHYRRAACR
jgi:hypothetical protein